MSIEESTNRIYNEAMEIFPGTLNRREEREENADLIRQTKSEYQECFRKLDEHFRRMQRRNKNYRLTMDWRVKSKMDGLQLGLNRKALLCSECANLVLYVALKNKINVPVSVVCLKPSNIDHQVAVIGLGDVNIGSIYTFNKHSGNAFVIDLWHKENPVYELKDLSVKIKALCEDEQLKTPDKWEKLVSSKNIGKNLKGGVIFHTNNAASLLDGLPPTERNRIQCGIYPKTFVSRCVDWCSFFALPVLVASVGLGSVILKESLTLNGTIFNNR